MCEWFQAGYFTMTLLVKRGCDEGFQPLGDVIKMWGRVPFAPGPSPPPLLVRQPPPTQRPQPTRGPAGTVSQSSANAVFWEGVVLQGKGKTWLQTSSNFKLGNLLLLKLLCSLILKATLCSFSPFSPL